MQGKTYRDVAAALGLSEADVKRLLTSDTRGVDHLVESSNMLGFSLAELAQEASSSQARLRTLSAEQERELVSDTLLLLVAVCALNHWTLADMLAAYRLAEAEYLQKLLHLDRLHLIAPMPGDRIRKQDACHQGRINHLQMQTIVFTISNIHGIDQNTREGAC